MESSAELDLLVAKACGLECGIDDDSPACWAEGIGLFRPSTDLNDAFLAAEKSGLFDGEYRKVLTKEIDVDPSPKWSVFTVSPHQEYLLANEATPALAICAAILKLKDR